MVSSGDKVVVITGASSGIGRETSHQFAARGASIVLAARSEEALEASAREVIERGGTRLVVPTDVAEWPQVQRLAAAAEGRFGHIDTWVNNAVVSGSESSRTCPSRQSTAFFRLVSGARSTLSRRCCRSCGLRGMARHRPQLGTRHPLRAAAGPLPRGQGRNHGPVRRAAARGTEGEVRRGSHQDPAGVREHAVLRFSPVLAQQAPGRHPSCLPSVRGRRGDRVRRRELSAPHLRRGGRRAAGDAAVAQPGAHRSPADRRRPDLRPTAARPG